MRNRRFAYAGGGPGWSPPPFAPPRWLPESMLVAAHGRGRPGRAGHGRGGRGWFGPWPGGGPRARRGDVRSAVLTLLEEEPMHGYQIIRELESRSGGAWRPSPGSVYPTLQLLEDEGLVRGEEVEGKRVFSLTEAGREHVAFIRERASTPPWEQLVDDEGAGAQQLREAAFGLGAAVLQVARAGSDEQMARALEILRDARKRVYQILAEDD